MTQPTPEPAEPEAPQTAGLVHVHWYGPEGHETRPAVFAECVATAAESGEVLAGVTGVTIRCSGGIENGAAVVELTELVDTDGRPLRRGRKWSGTNETVTSTYYLASEKPALGFGRALAELGAGRRVARRGWNGPGQWLVLVPGSSITVEAGRPLGKAAPELVGSSLDYAPHIDIRTVAGTIVPWFASQTDVLATDWFVVDSPQAPNATPGPGVGPLPDADLLDPFTGPDQEC